MKRVALHRNRAKDPVTPQVAAEVITRDLRVAGGCVAPHLDAMAGLCRDRWGTPVLPHAREALTLDHIREDAGGQRRSDARWLVTVCYQHHIADGWATSHRPLLREYLERVTA